jgi:adenylate cyclase
MGAPLRESDAGADNEISTVLDMPRAIAGLGSALSRMTISVNITVERTRSISSITPRASRGSSATTRTATGGVSGSTRPSTGSIDRRITSATSRSERERWRASGDCVKMPAVRDVDLAFLILGMMTTGVALIFIATDFRSGTSRALSLCIGAIGANVLSTVVQHRGGLLSPVGFEAVRAMLETVSVLAGIEWGRRIGETASVGRWRTTVNVLFRVAQGMTVGFGVTRLAYVAVAPGQATAHSAGVFHTSGLEFALFAPLLGTAMLLALIAIVMLLFVRTDPAESVRLRALVASSPFTLMALVLEDRLVAISLTIGLLIFLLGSMRYLTIQGRRGQFMSQFLSPEVARLMRAKKAEAVLRRERRRLTVVVCDIRGFTAYARTRDSDEVAAVLEEFYRTVGSVTARHRGTVKDHAGDGVLILVGAPLAIEDHAAVALALADDVIREARPILRARSPDLGLGVGVATGNTTIGAIQGAGRLEYVAVGNAVNLAARLCQRAADGEILLDEGTRRALGTPAQATISARAPEPLKGFSEPIPVFALNAPVAV